MPLPHHLPVEIGDAIASTVSELYPGAPATLLYGSTLSGERSARSDIDLLVILAGGDRMVERRVRRGGLTFQITAIPRHALPHLPGASRKAGRQVGLVGLVHGQVVLGALPELEDLRRLAVDAFTEVNAAMSRQWERNLRKAVEMAESALDRPGPGGTALALRAVAMLMEAELQSRSRDYFSTRSRLRALAEAEPDIVADYARIAASVAAGEMEPLAGVARRLLKTLPPPPDDEIVRNAPVAVFMR
ncbi:hypothetical protein GCM10011326_46410 [Salipiger profundus]|uniref:Nucleotidyltransferase family protein n=1 Tax=Salipiger profundus TaxID=1229727 RepID=A0A1U7DD33_9RHOB|nr:hypothetical protein Ga0080559_TMP5018 [Salipiger profundus]GGA29135.1 hypothetical protein GCM10011326_46410 [Salipiger profundus]